jgi:AcrR family transcriptional regulator
MAGTRLTKEARRSQLLDSAADLLLERGLAGVTMEGIAAQARVSKALPYVHFDNAESVLLALRRREVGSIGHEVTQALASQVEPVARIGAAVHAYFDAVVDRGAILSMLTQLRPSASHRADGEARAGHRFVAKLYVSELGLSERAARVSAGLLLGALHGAVDALAHGEGSRRHIEEAVVRLALHLGQADDRSRRPDVDVHDASPGHRSTG